MRKLIAAINLSVDGNCDHAAGLPEEAIHMHYTQLLANASLILYGRKTYQLMQYWQGVLEKPTGQPSMDDFARSIDRIPKLVFSHTLTDTGWASARLAEQDLETAVWQLKQENGADILVGSPGMITALTRLRLIDEYQLCIHPIIAGSGLSLFNDTIEKQPLTLINSKTFPKGHIILYYRTIHQ